MKLSDIAFPKDCTGFTLVELVIVIILISALSVTVFSRFSGTSGFAEYIYQARLISALRNMQTRAMHDNRNNYCFKVIFDTSTTPAFGSPTLTYAPIGNIDDTCGNMIDFNNPDYMTTNATEMSKENVSLSTTPTTLPFIDFDDLGRPIDGDKNPTCSDTCKITLSGESTVSVCIESEGYIHACD